MLLRQPECVQPRRGQTVPAASISEAEWLASIDYTTERFVHR
ncbi:hypothetical protein [Atlantibacter hermannii]|nr:hypothetical protein [Atlantibacter hermannii]